MTGRQLTPEEQAFLTSTGLEPDHLAPLVADAPALPADTLERIRIKAHQKAALPQVLTTDGMGQPTVPLPSRSVRPRRRAQWLAIAAASLLIFTGLVAISNPDQAMAALYRLVQLVPGVGLKETDSETLVLAHPVVVESGEQRLTITGVLSNDEMTEVRYRIEGLPWEKPTEEEPVSNAPPTLRLADGTLLSRTGSTLGGGAQQVGGILWFPPLPAEQTTFTLSLPPVNGVTHPFEVPIALVDAAAAELAEAAAGGWSEQRLGARVGVPYWTVRDEKIVLSLEAAVPKGFQVDAIGGRNNPPVLTDDTGMRYPLDLESYRLNYSTVETMSATFQGPLPAEARSLRLSVPEIRVIEEAEARLRIPLAKLPLGQPLPLNEQVNLGSHSFTIRTVTRTGEGSFLFDLNLGPEKDGALLQEISVEPRQTARGWSNSRTATNGQTERLELSADPPRGSLDVVFSRPVISLRGGWEVELAVADHE